MEVGSEWLQCPGLARREGMHGPGDHLRHQSARRYPVLRPLRHPSHQALGCLGALTAKESGNVEAVVAEPGDQGGLT